MKDSTKTYWGSALVGKYSISDDKLKVNITSEVEISRDGKVIKTTPNNYTLFDDGRFSIVRDVLTLNYTTYPADAPVATIRKYNKILAVD